MTDTSVYPRLVSEEVLFDRNCAQYDESRRVFNSSIDVFPEVVVRPRKTSHIVDALTLARSQDLGVTVRNGGHSAYGFGVGDGCMVIDMRGMNSMRLVGEGTRVLVEAGALSGPLDDFLAPYFKAIPLGDCPGVGVAGLALGGGNGFLSRKYGLTCDRIHRCKMVSVGGEVVDISDQENPELMWAVRGGGQCHFGVITELEFDLCDVPMEVVVGSVFFALKDGVDILAQFTAMMHHAPDDLSLFIRMNREAGEAGLRIYGVYMGDTQTGHKYFEEITTWSDVLSKDIRTCSYRDAQRINASSVVDGVSFHWENAMIRHELSPEFVNAMIDCFNRCPNTYGRINLDPMGGQIQRNVNQNSCFAHREQRYILSIIGVWPEGEADDRLAQWVSSTYETLQHWCEPRHRYTNYVHPKAMADAYFVQNTSRLKALRKEWDPDGLLQGILSRDDAGTLSGSDYI